MSVPRRGSMLGGIWASTGGVSSDSAAGSRARNSGEEDSLPRGRHRNGRRFSAFRGRGVSSHRPRTRVRPALAGHGVPGCGAGAGAGARVRLRDGARRVLGRAPPHRAVRPVRGAPAGRPRGDPEPPGQGQPVSPAGHRVAGTAPARDRSGGEDARAACREGPDRGRVVRGAPQGRGCSSCPSGSTSTKPGKTGRPRRRMEPERRSPSRRGLPSGSRSMSAVLPSLAKCGRGLCRTPPHCVRWRRGYGRSSGLCSRACWRAHRS